MKQLPWMTSTQVEWVDHLLRSYGHWVGADLLAPGDDPTETAQRLFNATFVVVSHGTEADPIFNYCNQRAMDLWQMDWETFTQTPSRFSAESVHRDERARMLAQLQSKGYIDNYQGIRISSQGQRFRIEQAIVWTVINAGGDKIGQAATFDQWQFLEPSPIPKSLA